MIAAGTRLARSHDAQRHAPIAGAGSVRMLIPLRLGREPVGVLMVGDARIDLTRSMRDAASS